MHGVSTTRNLCLVQLTQKFYVIPVLLSALLIRYLSDPMMTSGSLLRMMCLISSRAGLPLKSQCVMSSAPPDEIDTQFSALFSTFAILIVFSRDPSSASCVVTATAGPWGVVFPKSLLGTCCSVVPDCSTLTARGSLFVVILLLSSDPDGLGSLALSSSALSPSVAASSSLCSSLPDRATSLVPRSAIVMALGRAPDTDDPPYETRGCGRILLCVQRNSLLGF